MYIYSGLDHNKSTEVYESFSSADFNISILSEFNHLQFDLSTVFIWVYNTFINILHGKFKSISCISNCNIFRRFHISHLYKHYHINYITVFLLPSLP